MTPPPAATALSLRVQFVNLKRNKYFQRRSGTIRTDMVIVDTSPRYFVNPLVPYRIKMVRPGAKFVLVLRNPTDR